MIRQDYGRSRFRSRKRIQLTDIPIMLETQQRSKGSPVSSPLPDRLTPRKPRTFIAFQANRIAQLQLNQLQVALNRAGYSIRLDRSTGHWRIWHKSQKPSQCCYLRYDGLGQSIGRHWTLAAGVVPAQVLAIVRECVGQKRRGVV